MNENSVRMLQSILEALMSINTKGNDTSTMSNCLQALQDVIRNEASTSQAEEQE